MSKKKKDSIDEFLKNDKVKGKDEDVKDEDVKDEDVKDEDVKDEDVKDEEVKDELTRSANVSKDSKVEEVEKFSAELNPPKTKPKKAKVRYMNGLQVADISDRIVNGKTYKEVRLLTGETFLLSHEEFNDQVYED